jgi:hypothetical protein
MTEDDEYFARIDLENKEKLRAQLETEKASKHAQELRALHWHCCGKCGQAMDTHVFRGLEIEVCGHCGAVLLDKGELETLAGQDRTNIFSEIGALFGRSPK